MLSWHPTNSVKALKAITALKAKNERCSWWRQCLSYLDSPLDFWCIIDIRWQTKCLGTRSEIPTEFTFQFSRQILPETNETLYMHILLSLTYRKNKCYTLTFNFNGQFLHKPGLDNFSLDLFLSLIPEMCILSKQTKTVDILFNITHHLSFLGVSSNLLVCMHHSANFWYNQHHLDAWHVQIILTTVAASLLNFLVLISTTHLVFMVVKSHLCNLDSTSG